jgi:hypothetical protein
MQYLDCVWLIPLLPGNMISMSIWKGRLGEATSRRYEEVATWLLRCLILDLIGRFEVLIRRGIANSTLNLVT